MAPSRGAWWSKGCRPHPWGHIGAEAVEAISLAVDARAALPYV